ncbi:TonB-dependent receptor [Paracidovorax wautersii]|uniref:Iron complex outermembrane receptor protein n=1 Tax=Paracidovorax wautersii TaxID=1177982 RepID=A0ABU1IFH8_9BURK|nr:TonB-dependent receptor [Paracidovorax wautersii]MDR6215706.1 iron complex outermembrane receptor protein [Paracidovorax wautersii]
MLQTTTSAPAAPAACVRPQPPAPRAHRNPLRPPFRAALVYGCALAAAGATAFPAAAQSDDAATVTTTAAASSGGALPAVQVQGSAEAQRRFDAAASHTSVAVDGFTAPTPLVNLSELLAGQAGVVALDRGNYAQDLQIAVRGFGARSTFGVRGVRILVDGIPATMPDGQGQAATAQLQSAAQVDVLRGPLAQLYGNAAGGVLQVTTREPREGTGGLSGAQVGVAAGSSGQRLLDASLDFGDRTLGGLIDVSQFETDGWRDHSAARRVHLNGKLVARPSADTKITALVNLYDQPKAQDPLGLNRAQFNANPRQAASVADTFDTRKSVAQNQVGVVLEHQFNPADSVRVRAYGGTRDLRQYLSFSGAAVNSAGGVVDLDRDYYGLGLAWTHATRMPSGLPLTWTVGLDADRLAERRQGLVNNNGTAGDLRRNERDQAGNTDLFAQVDAWIAPTLRAVAGLRASRVRAEVDDRYITAANPDDSGSRSWRQTSPALGLVWAATEQLNLYANVGRGFETPTLAEMAYSAGNTGPNYALGASRSWQWELGAKWQGTWQGVPQRLDMAWFDARSRGEIVPAATVNGRTVFQNADNVSRCGLELAWSAQAGAWTPRAAYTYLDAFFGSAYTGAGGAQVPAGNRLPGTARHVAQLALDYAPTAAWQLGASVDLSGKVFADDRNTESAPGFAVVGLRAGYTLRGPASGGQTGGGKEAGSAPRWQLWARLDNLFDRRYAGSLIVNDGNQRFFEPAAGRRIMVGLRAQFL